MLLKILIFYFSILILLYSIHWFDYFIQSISRAKGSSFWFHLFEAILWLLFNLTLHHLNVRFTDSAFQHLLFYTGSSKFHEQRVLNNSYHFWLELFNHYSDLIIQPLTWNLSDVILSMLWDKILTQCCPDFTLFLLIICFNFRWTVLFILIYIFIILLAHLYRQTFKLLFTFAYWPFFIFLI